LEIEGQTVLLRTGDSWIVPSIRPAARTVYRYDLLQQPINVIHKQCAVGLMSATPVGSKGASGYVQHYFDDAVTNTLW
jgi:hypothetical protein